MLLPLLVETSNGSNWGHVRTYRTVLHWVTDNMFYAAIEATIFHNDHVLSFARVHISDDADASSSTAYINAVESFRISHDSEHGCASIKKRNLILDDELSAMTFMVALRPDLRFETNFSLGSDGGVTPSSMFSYSVSDDGRAIEISETPGVVRVNSAARAIWRAWRRYSQMKKAVSVIETAWLEHAYAPGGPGCARIAAAWPLLLAR